MTDPLVYYARYSTDGIDCAPGWKAGCSCGWRGERQEGDDMQQAKDEATCHAIETGHAPVWEPKR